MTDREAKALAVLKDAETTYLDRDTGVVVFTNCLLNAVKAALLSARNEALEEAAAVCSNAGDHDLAAVIRALKGE